MIKEVVQRGVAYPKSGLTRVKTERWGLSPLSCFMGLREPYPKLLSPFEVHLSCHLL